MVRFLALSLLVLLASAPLARAQADARAEYARRRAALEAERRADATSWFRLGAFAAAEGLAVEARAAFEKAVAIDPNHGPARAALGYERLDGAWLPRAEVARRKGLVPHPDLPGRFVTPEERAQLERGLVRLAGEWIPADELARREAAAEARREAARARALATRDGGNAQAAYFTRLAKTRARAAEARLGLRFFDFEDEASPFLIHASPGVSTARVAEVRETLAHLAGDLTARLGIAGSVPWAGKLPVFLFAARDEFDRFALAIDDAPGAVRSGGYFLETWDGEGTSRHVAVFDADAGALAHELAHAILAENPRGPRRLPAWVQEGTAEHLRARVAGDVAADAAQRALARELVAAGDERASLRTLLAKPRIGGEERWAYALARSLVDFLVDRDRTRFLALLRALKTPGEEAGARWDAASPDAQVRALEHAYAISFDELEKSWKAHVRDRDAE